MLKQLLVAGSRSFEGRALYRTFNMALSILVQDGLLFDILIHGGARGVDRTSGAWAQALGLPVRVYPADWDTLGKKAGYVRNALMVEDADAAIIVWDGESKGTKHTIDLMTKARKPYVLVVKP